MINNWIYKQNGLATSIALCFSGVAGAILSPIFSSLIESVGWEYTYFIVGIISFVLVLPFLLLPFKEKLEDENKLPYMMDESLVNQIQFEDEDVHFNSFQLKFILFFIVGILLNAITGMGSHFPTYALSIGFDATLGSLMLSATMVGNICFKFVIGVLSDMFGIIKAVYMMIIINIISLLMIIFLKNEVALLVASFLFGSIYSITAVGIAIMTRKFFGELNYSSAYANIQFGCNFGVAFAVSLIGFIYDFAASYIVILIIALIIGVITIGLLNIIQKMKTV